MSNYGGHHHKVCTVCVAHRRYRYTAYRHFVRWCWHYIGKDIRVKLPACVVHAIRQQLPAESESYTGFKLPKLH